MAALLGKFRIDYQDLVIITDANDAPSDTTKCWFDSIMRNFARADSAASGRQAHVSQAELTALLPKSRHQMRLRELLHQHSNQSNLIVM